jgi:hypothetical protein
MAVCSNSTATPTSTPTAGPRHTTPRARSSLRPTTATSLAVRGRANQEERCVLLLQLWRFAPDHSTMFTGAITPTAAERLGDFTADTFTVYTPGTAHVAANQVDGTNSSPNCLVAKLNCIPQALLDTTIANIDNVSNTIGSSIPLPKWRPQAGEREAGLMRVSSPSRLRKTNTWASMTRTSARRTMWRRPTSFRGTC